MYTYFIVFIFIFILLPLLNKIIFNVFFYEYFNDEFYFDIYYADEKFNSDLNNNGLAVMWSLNILTFLIRLFIFGF